MIQKSRNGIFEKEIKITVRYSKPEIARNLKRSDINLLKKAFHHISYEIQLFLSPYNHFKTKGTFPPVLIEVFLLHARNLYNFFYPAQEIYYDDMCVFDFLDDYKNFKKNRSPKKSFKKLQIDHINKFLSHITYERCNHNFKKWPCLEIGLKMILTIKAFLKSLPNDYKKWEDVIKLYKLMNLNVS